MALNVLMVKKTNPEPQTLNPEPTLTNIIKLKNIESRITEIKEQKVIIDSDVADLYGVETKRINEAVKNNQDKFPVGYIFELSKEEWGL